MKISVVMQSYLGDYPDSRKNPEFKFVRAVHSFLSQKHENKELIIVSDGCDITKNLYEHLYSNHPQIKFAYISKKQEKHMYEIEKRDNFSIKHYRGLPRRIGCSISSGDIITYMDSDDIMLPNRLSDLNQSWEEHLEKYVEKITFAWNPLRYLHANSIKLNNVGQTDTSKTINLQDYGYGIDETFYMNRAVTPGYIFSGTIGLSHLREVNAYWKDTTLITDISSGNVSGSSEDMNFLDELMKTGRGFCQESPTYVVCHYRNHMWDV